MNNQDLKIKIGLAELCRFVNAYEPKKRKYLQKLLCKFTYDKEGVLILFCGIAHNYSHYVKF